MNKLAPSLLIVSSIALSYALHAQESPPPLVEADGFETGETETPDEASPPASEVATDEVRRDISAIKQDIQLLQETLDLIVNRMMADLEQENAQLRAEVKRLQEQAPAVDESLATGFVPRPGAELFEAIAEEPMPPPVEESAPALFSWEIVSEWGRDPDTAARLGGEVRSLKGMVVMVPAGSSRADVENLARELRSQFEAYDNINIEIFDDPAAARSYADRQVADPSHRLLSISKHAQSGRDKILYLGGSETAEEVSATP